MLESRRQVRSCWSETHQKHVFINGLISCFFVFYRLSKAPLWWWVSNTLWWNRPYFCADVTEVEFTVCVSQVIVWLNDQQFLGGCRKSLLVSVSELKSLMVPYMFISFPLSLCLLCLVGDWQPLLFILFLLTPLILFICGLVYCKLMRNNEAPEDRRG